MRVLEITHDHPVSNSLRCDLSAIPINCLYNSPKMVQPYILKQVIVGDRIQLNGIDLFGFTMDCKRDREVTNAREHIHYNFILTELAHALSFSKVTL